MTMTVTEMKELRDKLQRRRWSGDRRVEYTANGITRNVQFASDIELRTALGDLERDIAAAEGKPTLQVAYVRSEKGWL